MSVYSFGFGGFGSLGTGELTNLHSPSEVPDIACLNVTHISVSLWHSLIITDTGRLYSLGRGRYGALGLGDDADIILTKPTRVPAFNDSMKVMDAAAGRFHSLAVTDDGCIWSFGFGGTLNSNTNLQVACGHGNTELNAEPQRILNMYRFKVKSVSGGEHHSACVTDEGKVFTWGLSHRVPLQATANKLGEEKVIRVSCGNKHGMILTDSGKLYGYGNNTSKQVCSSQPNHVDDAKPVQIHSQVQWTEVHAGLQHTMGLSSFNEVYLWGTVGAGCNDRDGILSLYKLETNLNIKSIFSGYSSFGIRTTDGLLFTWGYNEHGNLGHGHSRNVPTPTLIESIRSVNIGHVFSGGYNIYCMPTQGSTMSALLNGHFNTDVTISSGTERYPAHKCILSARSKVLADRITESSSLDVSDIIPSEELFAVLEFLYSNLTSKVPRDNRFQDTITKLGFERVHVNGVNASGDHAGYEQDVQKLISSPQEYHSDVSFKLDDEEELVHAHRCILSCKSEFFNAMFSTGMMESQARTIEFHDARRNVFLTMIHFMYNSDSIQLEVETSVEMLELGVRINWHRLRTSAERIILKHLDKDNVIDMMNVAELCSSASIKTAGIMLMAKNNDIDISSLDQEIISQVEHARNKIRQDIDRQVQIAQNEKQWLKKQEREQVDRERLAYIGTERDTQRVNTILRNREASNRCLIQ